jgi:UDP-N-acetyl-D-mannosaminouronate:lipid I N-acetyl-D-mannosaminouronosyltransferase
MESRIFNGVICFAPNSSNELVNYALKNNKILVAVNAEKILNATEETRSLINRNVGYPDGIGAVWALRQKGCDTAIKIPGCELWLDIVKQYETEKTFYLIGGNEEVIKSTVIKLKLEYPRIEIVNYRDGYLKSQTEKEELINDVCSLKPDFVFVAMGSPKQELLMEEMYKLHPAVYQGLGGSFDVYTGLVNRAPRWWVNNNLEWAYRLIQQPLRIKRQIKLFSFYFKLKFGKL